MIKIHLFIPAAIILLFSCSGEPEVDSEVEIEEPVFVSEVTLVDTTYPKINEQCLDIMEKLQMCTTSDTSKLAPCSNEYFRVFDYKPNKDWNEGFIVEMVPRLYGAPVSQIVIIEEIGGKYQIVNQYLGEMIELRSTKHGYSDLLIGYMDPDIGLVAIRHEWKGNKYDLVDVEEINNHFVKAEMKDSINAIFLPAFSAGF